MHNNCNSPYYKNVHLFQHRLTTEMHVCHYVAGGHPSQGEIGWLMYGLEIQPSSFFVNYYHFSVSGTITIEVKAVTKRNKKNRKSHIIIILVFYYISLKCLFFETNSQAFNLLKYCNLVQSRFAQRNFAYTRFKKMSPKICLNWIILIIHCRT